MGSYVDIDFGQYKDFFEKMKRAANGGFKKDMELFLIGLGEEFLSIVEDEIINRKVMDTRLLLASFHKGSDDSIWELDADGLVLSVGTNISYAAYVNDGHWTNPKGVEQRFVPGRWEGDRFIYEPGAKTGMVLKQKWVEGAHYWESAIRILEHLFPHLMEAKMQQWLNEYF